MNESEKYAYTNILKLRSFFMRREISSKNHRYLPLKLAIVTGERKKKIV